MSGSFNHGQAPRWQWWVVIFSGILTLACGTYGGINHVRESHPNEATTHSTILSAAYSSFQMLILHTPHYEGHVNIWLELGRWGGVVTLIATTWALFWSRLRYEFRLLRGWNKHYVICGLGHKGMAIVESIKQRGSTCRRRRDRTQSASRSHRPLHGRRGVGDPKITDESASAQDGPRRQGPGDHRGGRRG